jgi:hypothetical protein
MRVPAVVVVASLLQITTAFAQAPALPASRLGGYVQVRETYVEPTGLTRRPRKGAETGRGEEVRRARRGGQGPQAVGRRGYGSSTSLRDSTSPGVTKRTK